MTYLRQEIWRSGNPTYTDSMPAEATTQIRWISTKTMVAADGLTKSMKAEQLDRLMKTGWLNVEFQCLAPSPLFRCVTHSRGSRIRARAPEKARGSCQFCY